MTREQLIAKFPHASAAFIAANADDCSQRIRSEQPQPDERVSLVNSAEGEEACWHDAAESFEVRFIVYSQRPCDWDGYDIKALQDFLVTAGIIPGDGWKTLSGRVLSRQAATKEEERTVIEIYAAQSSE